MALDDGFTWNVPIIVGKTSIGRFWLYADGDVPEPHGLEFVFSVDAEYEKQTLFGKKTVKYQNHWHPQTIEDAIDDINEFMSGIHRYLR